MIAQNRTVRPDLKFLQVDACKMNEFGDASFSVIIDKGTTDAIFTDDSQSTDEYVQKYWSEMDRVLRIGGRYVIISLLQKHIIAGLLKRFAINNWMFRVVRCIEAEEKTAADSNDKTVLPVFMVIATKFQKLPTQVLEVCMAGDKMIRLNSTDEVSDTVLSIQKAQLVCSGLSRSNIADLNEVPIDLYEPTNNKVPRYTIHILDQKPHRDNGKYAAFIVPQGR